MIIREARTDDIEAISELARRTYSETFGDGLTATQLYSILESTRSAKYFNTVLGRDLILIALDEEKVLGYVQVSDVRYQVDGIDVTDNDQAIHSIYVDFKHQSRGVGKALINAAFNHPRIKKAEKIFIDVFEENTRALNFYTKYGFKQVGIVNVIVDDTVIGYDLVLMKENR